MQISRHINHTGRRKILHSEVEIELVEQNGKPPAFRAAFTLNREHLPDNADLFVEAYHSNTTQRFSFGTVAAPTAPTDTTLSEIDLSGPTLFRVKVVDNSESAGRLVASAERLAPKDDDSEEQRASLMIFKSISEMGNLTWRLSFDEVRKPVLCINNKIPEAKHQLLTNPVFQSLILPSAFREVLMYIHWDQGEEVVDGSWQEQWINFSNKIGSVERPSGNDPDILHSWIDDVVRAFSESHHFCDHLVKRMEESSHA